MVMKSNICLSTLSLFYLLCTVYQHFINSIILKIHNMEREILGQVQHLVMGASVLESIYIQPLSQYRNIYTSLIDMALILLTLLSLACLAKGQNVGTYSPETHLSLPMQSCTSSGCTTLQTSIVLDSNWRWLHSTTGYTNCYTGNRWDQSLCPDSATCTANCALEGIDQNQWGNTYGISTAGNALTLKFVTGSNVGSRVYLLASDTQYYMFRLKNREFSVTIDSSNLPCGLNGALYFIEMEADGGMASFPTNKAGAKYGTGYCDAQCPHDMKFINGQANSENWVPSNSDPNSGTGRYGVCCFEMDIWEANR